MERGGYKSNSVPDIAQGGSQIWEEEENGNLLSLSYVLSRHVGLQISHITIFMDVAVQRISRADEGARN